MKRLMILLAMSASLILVIGCGKDSTKQPTSDYNDARYLLAKGDIDSAMVESDVDHNDGSEWFGGVPLSAKVALDDSVLFDSTSFWHIFVGSYEGQYQTWARIDSFRFSDTTGEYQQNHTSQLETLEHRLHKNYVFDNQQSGVNWVKIRSRNVKWDGFTDSNLILTGTVQRSYTGQTPNWDFTYSMTGTFDSVLFNTVDFLNGLPTYPQSGHFTGTAIHDRISNNLTIYFVSEFTVTFYTDHYHVHLVSGSDSWNWDYYYIY
jgi:hypothetical protein